jgi:prepilin-type processing-associated H-X9-DG protein
MQKNSAASHAGAFTLLELLVACGIVSVLVGFLASVGSMARRSAQTAECLGNLRQLGQAAAMYAGMSDGWTPRDAYSASEAFFAPYYGKLAGGPPPDETVVTVGPYTGMRVQVDLEYCMGWLRQTKVFRCPADPREDRVLDYVINALDFDVAARWGIYSERTWQRLYNVKNPDTVIHLVEANWQTLAPADLGRYNISRPADLPFYTSPNAKAGPITPPPAMIAGGDTRHGRKTTALFFDGHVEARDISTVGSWPLSALNPHAK